jgi:predicted RND superfamily exporter protein
MKSPTETQDLLTNDISGIYNEAILFFAVFALMSIVSIIISKRNAKKYELEHSIKERQEIRKKDELIHKHLNSSSIKIMGKKAKDEELLKKLHIGAIDEEEYKILKEQLDSI